MKKQLLALIITAQATKKAALAKYQQAGGQETAFEHLVNTNKAKALASSLLGQNKSQLHATWLHFPFRFLSFYHDIYIKPT